MTKPLDGRRARRQERVLDGLRVLVVDDDRRALEALAEALDAYGARVTVAESAASALERLRLEAFDAVCSDLDMPGVSGLSLARAVRAIESGSDRHLPLVAVTGQLDDAAEPLARQAGFDAFIAKPVAIAALAGCLRLLADRNGDGA